MIRIRQYSFAFACSALLVTAAILALVGPARVQNAGQTRGQAV
jgi:hypothetical protein